MKFVEICLITDHVPTLVRFYEEVLQVKVDVNEIHSEINLDGISIAFYSRKAALEDMKLMFDGKAANVALTFLVDDVDAEYDRLSMSGVKILNQPKTYPWGARSMQFQDPDGNVISFACRVKDR